MANQIEEVLRIVAEVDSSLTSLEQIQLRIRSLKEEAAKIDVKLNPQAFEDTQRKITQLEIAETKLKNSTAQMSAEMRRAEGAVKGFGDAAAVSGGVAIALGQTFSDIGQFGFGFAQGIRAIANNISQVATLFTIAVVQAGSFKAAIRAIWATMMGPLGIVVALQMVIGAIDLWASSQRKAKEEADKLNERFDIQDGKVIGLYNAYKKLNPESEEAIRIKKELGKELKVNIDNYKDLNDAVLAHIKVLELEKDISYVLEERSKIRIQQRKLEAENTKLLAENAKTFQDRNEEQLKAVNELITNSPEVLRLKGEEVRLNNMLGDLYAKLIPLLKDDNKAKKESQQILKESKEVWDDYLRFVERGIDLLGDINKERQQASDELLTNEQRALLELERQYERYYNNLEQMLIHYGITEDEYRNARLSLEQSFEDRLLALKQQYADKKVEVEEKRVEKEIKQENQLMQAKLQLASNTVGFLISLNQAVEYQSEEGRKKAFKRDKALRVAQATIDTYAAATRALTTPAPPPIPNLIAASYIAAGLANVATILGQNYNGGTSAGGSGGMGGGGLQGGYPYPMSGFSNIAPQFPDRTGSLDIVPRTQRIYVLESDISGSQKTSIDREMKAGVF
jgi:hypothetical protein